MGGTKVKEQKPKKREAKANDKAKAKKTKESKSAPKGKYNFQIYPKCQISLSDGIMYKSIVKSDYF